jgi:hypothetical protein
MGPHIIKPDISEFFHDYYADFFVTFFQPALAIPVNRLLPGLPFPVGGLLAGVIAVVAACGVPERLTALGACPGDSLDWVYFAAGVADEPREQGSAVGGQVEGFAFTFAGPPDLAVGEVQWIVCVAHRGWPFPRGSVTANVTERRRHSLLRQA